MKSKNVLLGWVAVLFFSFASSLCFANELIVHLLKGDQGEVLKKGAQTWIQAKEGETLTNGDRIRTGKKSRLILIAKEGHRILMKQKTVFEIAQTGPDNWEFNEEAGRARIKVSPLTAGQTLKVNTPTAVCSIRGTEFEIVYENRQTICDVYQGVVGFSHALERYPEVNISKNERSIIDPFKAPTPPQPIPEKERTPEPELTAPVKEPNPSSEEPKPKTSEPTITTPTTTGSNDTFKPEVGSELQSKREPVSPSNP